MARPPFPRQAFADDLRNPVALNWLDALGRVAAADGETTVTVDLETFNTAIAELTADIARAQRRAEQVELKIPPQLSREEILAITDTALLTEDGDYLLTEDGDRLLLEA